MKNLTNFGFIALLLVVLGCNCQKMRELSNESKDNPPSTPVSTSSPGKSPTSSPATTTDGKGLTKANYEKIKNGMSYKEVVEILGEEGDETSSSEIGKTKIASYKWQGEGYAMIFVNFTNDKVTFKSNANLK